MIFYYSVYVSGVLDEKREAKKNFLRGNVFFLTF